MGEKCEVVEREYCYSSILSCMISKYEMLTATVINNINYTILRPVNIRMYLVKFSFKYFLSFLLHNREKYLLRHNYKIEMLDTYTIMEKIKK
jgi:hypothetical protein